MFDIELFKTKGKKMTLEQLFGEIYNNQQKNSQALSAISKHISDKITTDEFLTAAEIQNLSYSLVDYFKISVTNDEHLIKLTAVITKFLQQKQKKSNENENDFDLTEEEKQELMRQIENI